MFLRLSCPVGAFLPPSSIQPSQRHQSGYALRFPRIARIRNDKTVAEIDTLETCHRLANASFADATIPKEAAG